MLDIKARQKNGAAAVEQGKFGYEQRVHVVLRRGDQQAMARQLGPIGLPARQGEKLPRMAKHYPLGHAG